MRRLKRNDSRWGFFGPFYKTRRGHIFGLASPRDHLRDGLATTLIARHFPLPEYEGIVVEPSRRNIHPAENLILVGDASLFVSPSESHSAGAARPAVVAEKKLASRLQKIDAQCCYVFEGTTDRTVLNGVTGEVYRPHEDRDSGVLEDYGVIRRVFRGPLENTIILEGVHRLGTLGAAKVATNTHSLDAIWDAVSRLPSFDETLPLEILVHATFHDDHREGVFSLNDVSAVPLFVVHNRQWIFDLSQDNRWVDQLPWEVHRWACRDAAACAVEPGAPPSGLPRLEIEVDLREATSKLRKLARKVFSAGSGSNGVEAPPPPSAEQSRLLRDLVAETDRFRIVLVDEAPFASDEKHLELPQGNRSHIRTMRKQFFLHMALCRMLGCGFQCDEESIRTHFPRFEGGQSAKAFSSQFVGSVPGKLREGGFEALLGTARSPRGYLRIDYSKKHHTYAMRLERSSLVVKFRL